MKDARAEGPSARGLAISIVVFVSLMGAASTSAAQMTHARTSVTDAILRRLPIRQVDASGGFRVSDDTLDFGRIAGGCLLGGGRAVFLSTVPRVLLVLQTRSAPAVRLVGKGGSGPGEFSQPWAMSCFSDDSVAVLELARITLVDVARGASTSFATQPLQQNGWYEATARLSENTYVFRSHHRTHTRPLGSGRDTIELFLGRGLPQGAIAGMRIGRFPGEEHVRVRLGQAVTTGVHPFGRTLLLATGPTTIYAMDTGTRELSAYSSAGRVTHKAQFDLTPRELTKAAVAAHKARRLSASRSPVERSQTEALLDETPMPRSLPLFDKIVPVSSGGVLLREFVIEGDSVARWIEFDSNLRPRASLLLPPALRLLAADASSILGVESSADRTELVYLPARQPRD